MKLPLLQTGSQLCWGQGGLWTFQDKHMCKSLSGWGSQDTAYSEPEKQLHWRTLLRPEFRGITEAVQKCTALKPRFFLKAHQLALKCAHCLPWLPLSSSIYHLQKDPSPLFSCTEPTSPTATVNWGLSLHTVLVLLTNWLCSKGHILLVNLLETDRSQHTEGSPSCFGSMRY